MTIFTKNNGLKGGHSHRRNWAFDRKYKRWIRICKVRTFPLINGDMDIDPDSLTDQKFAQMIQGLNELRDKHLKA